jgi:hypothetical protein
VAFGISKSQLKKWKNEIDSGEIAIITHFWIDERFPNCNSVTKVGCHNIEKLVNWGTIYGLKEEWIHHRKDGYSHFDLLGDKQAEVLLKEGHIEELNKFCHKRIRE